MVENHLVTGVEVIFIYNCWWFSSEIRRLKNQLKEMVVEIPWFTV